MPPELNTKARPAATGRPPPASLTPIDTALDMLLANLAPITAQETVPLASASGRILATAIVAASNVPAQAVSAMDGYAIHTADQAAANSNATDSDVADSDAASANATSAATGTVLPVTERISAGQVGEPLPRGQAARIFTGAPLPKGADAVVMQEDCKLENKHIRLLTQVNPDANLRQAGEDITAGAEVLPAGHRLRPQDVGILASLGLTEVSVRRPLRVALLTTGDELAEPGQPLAPGQIYNANRHTLTALLAQLPVTVIDCGTVGDDLEATRAALFAAKQQTDCIICTGGVSVGEEDHVKTALQQEGSLKLWKLAIKPGKPLAYGKLETTHFFGLPGNPVSAFVTFCLIVRPCLLTMLGCNQPFPKRIPLPAGFTRTTSGQRQEYLRASVRDNPQGHPELQPHPKQNSGIATSLSNSDGLAIIPPHTAVAAGDMLEFIPYSEMSG